MAAKGLPLGTLMTRSPVTTLPAGLAGSGGGRVRLEASESGSLARGRRTRRTTQIRVVWKCVG